MSETDLAQHFEIESSGFRGRAVRLGSVLDVILAQHDYPAPLAHLLAEMVTLAVTLSSLLRYEGVFTLQARGDGPVGFAVVDVTSARQIRGFAKLADGREAELENLPEKTAPRTLLGKGHLAFTVDQGGGNLYQGLVDLSGATMADCVRHYFRQSEQMETGMILEVGQRAGHWHSHAILLQKKPAEELDIAEKAVDPQDEDAWRRAMMLLSTTTREEMLDADLPINMLLFRLFHEDGVRVYDAHDYAAGCSCSREKLEKALATINKTALKEMQEADGHLHVTCEFCNRDYIFTEEDLDAIFKD